MRMVLMADMLVVATITTNHTYWMVLMRMVLMADMLVVATINTNHTHWMVLMRMVLMADMLVVARLARIEFSTSSAAFVKFCAHQQNISDTF